jgi:prophage regulatory protein
MNGELDFSVSTLIPTRRYIRARELARRLSVHRTTLWRWVHDGRMPRPVRLGPNTVAWDCTQIDTWLAARSGGVERGGV